MIARKKKQARGIPLAAAASQVQTDLPPQRCNRPVPIAAAVKVRRLTPEEERRLEAVLDLFLVKIVHEHFERQQEPC